MDDFNIPRDQNGAVLPHDHPNFGAGENLIRRISAEHIVPDNNRGCNRLSSAVFKFHDPADHLSCDSTACITALKASPIEWVSTDGWLGALTLEVDDLRAIQGAAPTMIGMVPLDENECHGGIWGKITAGRAKEMLRKSEWLIGIPGVAKSDQDDPA